MRKLIDEQAAIDALIEEFKRTPTVAIRAKHTVEKLSSAQPEPQWIPFKTRPLTEEEKEDYPGWDSILDCKLPDDGQMILVSINLHGHERVQYDEFFVDDGCYLDSGYELGAEAIAWMPLPEPYVERREV